MTSNTEFSSQRWLLSKYKQDEPLAAQFLELDNFLRGFPRLHLETNEYILTQIEGDKFIARRITGFHDLLPDGYQQRDWFVRTLSEKESSWDELFGFLNQNISQKTNNLNLYVVNGLTEDSDTLAMKVVDRLIEHK